MAENSEKRARGQGRPFEIGKSGNPGGRPKVPEEFKELAKKYSIDALERCITIVRDPKANVSHVLKAAELIMDRAFGKPIQAKEDIEVNDYDEYDNMTEEELEAEISELAKQIYAM